MVVFCIIGGVSFVRVCLGGVGVLLLVVLDNVEWVVVCIVVVVEGVDGFFENCLYMLSNKLFGILFCLYLFILVVCVWVLLCVCGGVNCEVVFIVVSLFLLILK